MDEPRSIIRDACDLTKLHSRGPNVRGVKFPIMDNIITSQGDRMDEVARLQAAIRKHRDYRGDDRCWMDDVELYSVLPEGYTPKTHDTFVELENCKRYIERRHSPGTEYVSPQREIERLRLQAGWTWAVLLVAITVLVGSWSYHVREVRKDSHIRGYLMGVRHAVSLVEYTPKGPQEAIDYLRTWAKRREEIR